MGLFGDFATAITGVELEVEDERHLWSSRPCVFIFNHQSKADVMILAKLIRRDMGGVGKKEIKDIPILGKLMEWGGTVFVDRADGKSAIKAMEPLVDAIQKEGKSICIAPEGTRSLTPKLRSEEHTSELQSLMRISYAVFCLKKKKKKKNE